MASFRPSPNVVTGPTRFSGSTHQFTGSVEVTGTLLLNGVAVSTGGGGGGISWDGSTANGVATFKDADEATVESNLTFDGSTLSLTGDLDVTSTISGSGLYLGTTGVQKIYVETGHLYLEAAKNNKNVIVKLFSTSGESFKVVDSAGQLQFEVDGTGDVDIPQGDLTIALGDLTVGDDIKTAGHLHVGSTSSTSHQADGTISGSGDFYCGDDLFAYDDITSTSGNIIALAGNLSCSATLIGAACTLSGTDSGNPDTAIRLCDTDAKLLRSNIAGGSGDTLQLKMSNGTISLSASAAIQIYALDGFMNSVSVLDSALYVKTTNPGGPPTSHFIATTDAGVGIGAYSIGTGPMVALDVHYSGTLNPTTLPTLDDGGLGAGGGHVAYYGTSSATLQSGSIYYLNSDGGWATATATVTGSGHNQLLGIPLSSSVAGNEGVMNAGILLKGYINIPSDYWGGDFIKGGPVYIQSGSNGFLSGAAPTAADAYVRVVGYCTDTANVIYFDPDATYVEIS